ncbi:MAG: hypothetical protein JNJ85_09040, partial [Candidatus Kapabacteria bacterium]|nr:hypothetical protein [Candidatus Kapabacteria bacterium]
MKKFLVYSIYTISLFVLLTSSTLSQSVSISPKGPITLCEGESIELKASSGYAKYIWNRSDTTQSIVVNRSGYYTVSVQDIAGNLFTSDEVEVIVVSKPTEPTIVQIDSNSLQTTFADFYQWYKGSVLLPGATKQILDIATLGAGSYHVVVSNKKGCKNISKDYLIAMKLTF